MDSRVGPGKTSLMGTSSVVATVTIIGLRGLAVTDRGERNVRVKYHDDIVDKKAS